MAVALEATVRVDTYSVIAYIFIYFAFVYVYVAVFTLITKRTYASKMMRLLVDLTYCIIRTRITSARIQIEGAIISSVTRWTATLVTVNQIDANGTLLALNPFAIVDIFLAIFAVKAGAAVAMIIQLVRFGYASPVV